ncbi:MAG: chemotaxis protein CheW [Pseudomonadota bacterium]
MTVKAAAASDDAHFQFVSFRVGLRAFGVDIVSVREITQWAPTTALPNQAAYTLGVLNLRGTIIPVHDLRVRFGENPTPPDETHVILIVSISGQTIGLLVDAVSDIVTIHPDAILPVPAQVTTAQADALCGLVQGDDGMVAILRLDHLFETPANAA